MKTLMQIAILVMGVLTTNSSALAKSTGSPMIQISQGVVDFGQVKLTKKTPMPIQISNTGSATLNISTMTIQGSQASDFTLSSSEPLSIAAGKQSTITIYFAPQQLGSFGAAINIVSNDAHSPASVQLRGEGVQAKLSLNSAPIDFGEVLIGSQSQTSSLNLQNTGNIPLNITAMTLTGSDASAFGMSPTSPFTIAAGASARVSVWFIASSKGSQSAKLRLTSDGVPTAVDIALSGTGVLAPALMVSTNSLDFGQIKLSKKKALHVKISNTGGEPLDISSITLQGAQAGEFSLFASAPAVLAPGKHMRVAIDFKPQQIGAASATLNIVSNGVHSPATVQLQGEGAQAQLVVDSSTINFGEVAIGEKSLPHELNLQNTGNLPLKIPHLAIRGAQSNTFGMTAPAAPIIIAPGSSVKVSVWFMASSAGPKAAKLHIRTDGMPAEVSVDLTGTGINIQPPSLQVSSNNINFGQVKLNATSPMSLTLANVGGSSLNISALSIQGAQASEYTLSSTAPLVLAPQQQTTLTISFYPQQLGAASATVNIISNDPGSPITIQLQGTGVQAQLVISQPQLDFGQVIVGSESAPSSLLLQNTGNISLNITSMTLSGAGAGAFSVFPAAPISIPSGSSVTFSLWFSVTTLGSQSATLTITTDGIPASANVILTGTGVAPHLQVNANNIAFGSVIVNAAGSAQLSISNTGTASLNISAITITGAQANEFEVSSLALIVLEPQQQTTLSISFNPQQMGAASAALNIVSNDTNSPATIQLEGAGTQGQLVVSQSQLDFGQILVGSQSAPSPLNLQNTGNIPLNILSMTLTGMGSSAFGTPLTAPTTILPGGNLAASIWYNATAEGSQDAVLTLTTDSVPTSVTIVLSGAGIQPHMQVSTNYIEFGSVPLAGGTINNTVTVTNSGSAPLVISSATISSAQSGVFTTTFSRPITIMPQSSSNLGITFVPTVTGDSEGQLTLIANAPESPLTVKLHGSVIAPMISVNSQQLNFASTQVGSSALSQLLTISNIGSAPLLITAISIGGSGGVNFSSDLNGAVQIAPDSSITSTISFLPQSSGSFTAQLTISSNANNSLAPISLVGAGYQPQLILSNQTLDFGTLTIDQATTLELNISSNASSVVTINSFGITGANLDFTYNYSSDYMILPQSAQTLSVTFTPLSAGNKTATLTITSNIGSATVSLTGIANPLPLVASFTPINNAVTTVVLGGIAHPLSLSGLTQPFTVKIFEHPNHTAPIILDGTGSMDANNQSLTYNWSIQNVSGTYSLNHAGGLLGVALSPDTYTVRLAVSDGSNTVHSNPQNFMISHVDLSSVNASNLLLNGFAPIAVHSDGTFLTVQFDGPSIAGTLSQGVSSLKLTGAINGSHQIQVIQ